MAGNTAAGMPPGMGGFSVQSTHYMNAEASRVDTKTQFGPMNMVTRQIDLCPTKKTLNFFDEGKLYSESTLFPASMMPGMPGPGGMPGMGGPGGRPGGSSGPKQTGMQTISFTFRDLGSEKILNIPTRHYALDMTMTASGCAGKGTNKIKMEAWTANFPMPAPCLAPTSFEGAMKSLPMRQNNNCKVTMKINGNTASASKAFGGFMMRMKFGLGQGTFTREVTQLSRLPIPASTFRPPAGYRKVSAAELDKARQSAMMQGMMGGMMGRMGQH